MFSGGQQREFGVEYHGFVTFPLFNFTESSYAYHAWMVKTEKMWETPRFD